MSINWYPGHMVKARREIEENVKLVDIAVILLDARAPLSCRNPDLEEMVKRKKIVFILNKADLASPEATRSYIKYFKQEGYLVAAMDSISGRGSRQVVEVLRAAYKEKAAAMKNKGRRVRPARVMVVGVPNIGKSTFLNAMVGKKMARTGERPGVTRGKQWIRVREDIEFMDTPGLMWPRIGDPEQGLKLALLNIIGENAYHEMDVCLYLLRLLRKKFPWVLTERYKVDEPDQPEGTLLEIIARKRGHLVKGGELDLDKTCQQLILDYRKGNLGRISLD
ncbi:ribosome biogenesis GTPase YlqF [Syntrophomonas erecta]